MFGKCNAQQRAYDNNFPQYYEKLLRTNTSWCNAWKRILFNAALALLVKYDHFQFLSQTMGLLLVITTNILQ